MKTFLELNYFSPAEVQALNLDEDPDLGLPHVARWKSLLDISSILMLF